MISIYLSFCNMSLFFSSHYLYMASTENASTTPIDDLPQKDITLLSRRIIMTTSISNSNMLKNSMTQCNGLNYSPVTVFFSLSYKTGQTSMSYCLLKPHGTIHGINALIHSKRLSGQKQDKSSLSLELCAK